MTHEEKLAEAKRLYKTANADQMYVLESLFPELKESEDERIRNGLIALLRFSLEDGSAIAPGFNETKEQALTWLEKQGEPLNESVYDTEDKEIYQAISIGLTDVFNECGWSDFGGIPIENIQKWLEKQGESKLAGCEDDRIRKWLVGTIKQIPDSSIEWETISKSDVLAWLENQGKQKPAKWSEEDEKKIKCLIKGLEDRMGFGWASDPFSRE